VQIRGVAGLLNQHPLGEPRGAGSVERRPGRQPHALGEGRRKRKTANTIYLTDRQGLPLAMSGPVSGNHNDLFDIEAVFDGILRSLGRP